MNLKFKTLNTLLGIFGIASATLCGDHLQPLASTQETTPTVEAQRLDLTPTAQMHTETLYMMKCLSGIHYERRPISSLSTSEILDTYLKELDPHHLYFLQSDVDYIHSRYELTLDIFLNSGSIKPAFVIYQTFLERVNQQIQQITELLDHDINLSDEEFYTPDRKKEPWPTTAEEQQTLWRKRIEFELLNELLLGEKQSPIAELEGVTDPEIEVEGAFVTAEHTPEENALSDAEKLEKAKASLKKRYLRQKEMINDVEPWLIEELFLNSIASLYDPHSSFMSADTWEEFQSSMKNSLVGIGAVLMDDEGYCKVVEIIPGSPAEASQQIQPGDRIIAVGQGDEEPVDIIGMRLNRSTKLIRGKKGTLVKLYIQPADGDPSDRKIVPLIRDEIQLTAQRAQGKLFQLPDEAHQGITKLGYIKLPTFYGANDSDESSDTYGDVKEILGKLQQEGIQGLVLDLRGNTGGLFDEAIALAQLFLPAGPIAQVRDNEGHIQVFSNNNAEATYNGPMIVLVNKQSASASEILSGALQNYHRALIVGDHSTYGKGTAQFVLPMNQSFAYLKNGPQLGAARITAQKWYLPNGKSIQQHGVQSDITFPSYNDHLPISEADYDLPLACDEIPQAPQLEPLSTEIFSLVSEQLVQTLQEKSSQRSEMPERHLLQANVERFAQKSEQKEFSLQLEQRRQQRLEDQAYREMLKQELEELKSLDYETKEILLDVANGNNGKNNPHISTNSEEKLPEFDIPLRETLRILQDWQTISRH